MSILGGGVLNWGRSHDCRKLHINLADAAIIAVVETSKTLVSPKQLWSRTLIYNCATSLYDKMNDMNTDCIFCFLVTDFRVCF